MHRCIFYIRNRWEHISHTNFAHRQSSGYVVISCAIIKCVYLFPQIFLSLFFSVYFDVSICYCFRFVNSNLKKKSKKKKPLAEKNSIFFNHLCVFTYIFYVCLFVPYGNRIHQTIEMFSLTKCVQLLQKNKVVVIFGYIRWFVFYFPKYKPFCEINTVVEISIATQEFRTCVFNSFCCWILIILLTLILLLFS